MLDLFQFSVEKTNTVKNTTTNTFELFNAAGTDAVNVTGTVGGQSYTWKGADMTTKPDWNLTDPTSGDAFQFTETYSAPGLQNVTTINRQIETESVVTTTSVFQ